MINKKAQGLPLNTIVIAAIAIIVLIVMVMFFSGSFRKANQGLDDCPAKGGYFHPTAECPEGGIPTPTGLEGDNKYCCIRIGGD